jgi:hypothetical protein
MLLVRMHSPWLQSSWVLQSVRFELAGRSSVSSVTMEDIFSGKGKDEVEEMKLIIRKIKNILNSVWFSLTLEYCSTEKIFQISLRNSLSNLICDRFLIAEDS